jgi:hypothetical protein
MLGHNATHSLVSWLANVPSVQTPVHRLVAESANVCSAGGQFKTHFWVLESAKYTTLPEEVSLGQPNVQVRLGSKLKWLGPGHSGTHFPEVGSAHRLG